MRGFSRLAWLAAALAALLTPGGARAGIDLVTLPERESVQLTIYNSADLTLVREVRKLTLRQGVNKLSFGWADTLIDPTSLSLRAVQQPDKVTLLDVAYPPRTNTVGVWTVQSGIEGEVPVEITFFTSGISWRAYYVCTLASDEKTMRLEGFVRVSNQSGEDYADAQTRLVVGRINLLDQIAELARRPHPYGRPGVELREEAAKEDADVKRRVLMDRAKMAMPAAAPAEALAKPKEIIKEGLSEYFLYTIEGTETIPNRWSKRLPCFPAKTVPVVNLFKYDDRRFGDQVVRFLLFRNDKQHTLGETPLPDGLVRVFRNLDDRQHLSYEGACPTQYIPVDQKCELNLGANRQVIVKPKLMDLREENFTFNPNGDISGWERVETWMVEVKNRRAAPARLEIKRHFPHPYWNMEDRGQVGEFRKDDADTIEYTLELPPNTERKIQYVVRFFEGERRERR